MSKLRTQIGGKYSRHNTGLFKLKLRLTQADIVVDYPTGNSIVKTVKGVDLTFDPNLTTLDFYGVEKEYLKAIRRSSFHTVYNINKNYIGYVGRSAGMEIAYAMLHSIPIIFLYKPLFQRTIPPVVRKLLDSKAELFKVRRLDRLPKIGLVETLKSIAGLRVDYDLSLEDEIVVMAYVQEILNEYKT